MEDGELTNVGKIAITLSVIGGLLLIAALIAIAFWYCNVTSRRKNYKEYKKSLPRRTLSEIEIELRQINHGQPTSKAESEASPLHKQTASSSANPAAADAVPAVNKGVSSAGSSPPSTGLVVIRETRERKSKPLSDTVVRAAAEPAVALPDTRISTISSEPAVALRDTRISTISSDVYSHSNFDALYGGILWPDVIDPYHRGQELELRIGGKAAEMYNGRPATYALQFR